MNFNEQTDSPEKRAKSARTTGMIECYYSQCEFHPKTEPFCPLGECRKSREQLVHFHNERIKQLTESSNEISKWMIDNPSEQDPHGKDPHEPGAKLDAGKPRPWLVLGGFRNALMEVVKVGTMGAAKYSDHGWLQVPDAQSRYLDAALRHILDTEEFDKESGLPHLAHAAWNVLAVLELRMRGI